jgi:hypothetical protein
VFYFRENGARGIIHGSIPKNIFAIQVPSFLEKVTNYPGKPFHDLIGKIRKTKTKKNSVLLEKKIHETRVG